jgi:hypothetical protein
MRSNAMLLTIPLSSLLLWNQFKKNSDKNLHPQRKHQLLVKVNMSYYWLHQESLSRRNSRNIAVSVVNRGTNQLNSGTSLKRHTRNLVLNFLTNPSLQLPNPQLPVLIAIRQDTLNNNTSKKRNQSAKKDEKVNIIILVTEHNLLSKGLTSHFTANAFIADYGATCDMRGSIEGMFNLKPHITVIMVGNNETMSSVSKENYRGLVLQQDGSSFEVILKYFLYIPKLMVHWLSLTKAISTKGVQLSSKGQIITLQIGTTLTQSFNMVLVSFWVFNYTLFPITLQPLLILCIH